MEFKGASPRSKGSLTFLPLDLADLSKIKQSADFFLARERKLNVLWNNAGIMKVAPGEENAKTAQGHEIHMGTNCLGAFLFTKLLTPILSETAKTAPAGQVRVIWVSSTIDLAADKNTGFDVNNLDYKTPRPAMNRYGYSKVGNYFQAVEYARQTENTGIVSLAANPGNLRSDLYREHGGLTKVALNLITHAPINGSYTLLYAGLSPEITAKSTGSFGKYLYV
jgi:NAD(P)-dependent dehydrogenase (short-subunit alcohol dehydrogenase family)